MSTSKRHLAYMLFINGHPTPELFFDKTAAIEAYTILILLGADEGIRLSEVEISRCGTFYKTGKHKDKLYFHTV